VVIDGDNLNIGRKGHTSIVFDERSSNPRTLRDLGAADPESSPS
jgi:hypothetical protein